MEIKVLRRVLQKNDLAASENRLWLEDRHITCINILGGAGSGKTAALESILPMLRGELRCAVLEGDLATTRDAERIAALDVPVIQLLTDGGCHLTATHVQQALSDLPENINLLIIENVGNPICPANFDLGEHLRISTLSVAEGDDKPSKYPLLFRDSALTLITKCDLLPYVRFDMAQARRDLLRLNHAMEIMETSARIGRSIHHVAAWIMEHALSLSTI